MGGAATFFTQQQFIITLLENESLAALCSSAVLWSTGSSMLLLPRSLITIQTSNHKRWLLFQVHMVLVYLLLEYFAGEKPLRMSQISRKCNPLRDLTIAFWQGSCVFTSNNLGFADFIEQPSQNSQMFDARKTF